MDMPDFLNPTERSTRMACVRSKDTEPELWVRRLAHRLGYRFRLHRRDLPGKPDIVFPGRRKIVFVNGCFWHGHQGCKRATRPQARREFWAAKIEGNAARDARNLAALMAEGWDVLTVWECEIRDVVELTDRLHGFLGPIGEETIAFKKRKFLELLHCNSLQQLDSSLKSNAKASGEEE